MQLDFDSLSVALSNATAASEVLVTWLDVRLMDLGLDSATILARGPSLVLMGLAFSVIRLSLRRIRCFGAECARLVRAQRPESRGVDRRQLIYVMNGHSNGKM